MELIQLNEQFFELKKRFEKHEKEEAEKFDSMIQAIEHNTESINELTKSTQAIVQLHHDLQGAARVGKGVQGFFVWLLKWGAIGAAIVAMLRWVLKVKGV